MTFISYAQNYEDVVLWRALRDVECGFYVDVGAADPTIDSVTRAFYERGWSGFNIEPTEPYFTALESQRPRDVNLRVLAGARAGVRTVHIIEGAGLSTINGDFAARHVRAGYESRDLLLPELRLNQILEPRAGLEIHFLKIDVEGAEADVLSGIDLKAFRPWIILVEATEPNSQTPTCHLWEHLLLKRDYEFAYFDGLNCFYTAIERAELKEKLAVPPNVFDDFLPFSEARLRDDVIQLSEARLRDDVIQQTYRAQTLVEAQAVVTAEIARFEAELGRRQAGLTSLEELSAELSQKYDNLLSEYAGIVRKFNDLTESNLRAQYLLNRSILEKLFFRVDGRPVRGLRRLLFHNSGKPRKLFRILVLQKNGKPRRAFSYWMTSQEEHDNSTPGSPPADRLPPRLGPAQSDGEFLITGGELLYGRGLTPPEIVFWQDVIKGSPEKRNDFAVAMINQHINQILTRETQDQVRNDPSMCQIMGTSRILTRQVWDERRKPLSATNNDDSGPLQDRPTIRQCSFEHTGSCKVSMIASLYKGGLFIRPFLENITSLSLFDSAELIIIDANSPDQEHVVIKEYQERFPNIIYRRINYRIAVYEAWNLGVEIARGHYLTNTNLDDLRRHDSIALQAALLDKNDEVDVVYQDFYYSLDPHLTFEKIAAYGFKSELPIITPHNLLLFNSPHNAPMWRASLHNDVGKFDTRYRSAGDYEFWLRCLANGKTFRKINTPHVAYYHNPEGISTQPDTRGIEEAQDILRRYSGKLVSPALLKSRRDFWATLGTNPPGATIADNTPYYDMVQSALLRLGASRSATDASRS